MLTFLLKQQTISIGNIFKIALYKKGVRAHAVNLFVVFPVDTRISDAESNQSCHLCVHWELGVSWQQQQRPYLYADETSLTGFSP